MGSSIAISRMGDGIDRRVIALGLTSAIVLGASQPSVLTLMQIWATSSTWSFGALVIPAVIFVIAYAAPVPNNTNRPWVGVSIFVVACGAWALGRLMSANIVEHMALIAMLIGVVGTIFGTTIYKRWGWPLSLLFLAVPFGVSLIPALQSLTTQLVVTALSIVSDNVVRDEFILTVHNERYAIAEACAGLNVLLASFAFSAFFTYFVFAEIRDRLAFLFGVMVLAIIANAIRVFTLIALDASGFLDIENAMVHASIGIIIYAIVFSSLIVIALRSTNWRRAKPGPSTDEAHLHSIRRGPILIIIALAVMAAIGDKIVITPNQDAINTIFEERFPQLNPRAQIHLGAS